MDQVVVCDRLYCILRDAEFSFLHSTHEIESLSQLDCKRPPSMILFTCTTNDRSLVVVITGNNEDQPKTDPKICSFPCFLNIRRRMVKAPGLPGVDIAIYC